MRHMVCSCGAVVQFEAAWLDCRVVSAATDTLVACWMALCVPFASSSPPFALYYLNTAIHDGTAACNGCWAFASSSRFLTVFEMYGGCPARSFGSILHRRISLAECSLPFRLTSPLPACLGRCVRRYFFSLLLLLCIMMSI